MSTTNKLANNVLNALMTQIDESLPEHKADQLRAAYNAIAEQDARGSEADEEIVNAALEEMMAIVFEAMMVNGPEKFSPLVDTLAGLTGASMGTHTERGEHES